MAYLIPTLYVIVSYTFFLLPGWSDAFSYDIPFSDSKIYAGTLSDGRN